MADSQQPTRSLFQVYVYAVCFVTVLVLLFSVATAMYSVVRVSAPGTTMHVRSDPFGVGFGGIGHPGMVRDARAAERDAGLAQLIESLLLGGVAAGVFVVHWRQAERLRAEARAKSRPSARRKPSPRRGKSAR